MLKTKDGYAKLIGTTYKGSSDYLLLSDGTSTRISDLSVKYASSAGNADTLDGEHADNFVRAGAIATNNSDFNSLDTYSFIKSVWSTKVDTSPKGIPGWYNVIQLVHRNGMTDGPDYIGQIALGMTVNMDDMFFRTKRYKDSQNPWNPWRTILHDGNSSISGNTIKINNTTLTVANSNHNHDNVYLKLSGGYMNTGARIGVTGGDLYIGDPDNEGWLYVQDIASQDGTDSWTISTDGSAEFDGITIRDGLNVNNIYANYNISVGGQVCGGAKSSTWYKGRDNALLRETSVAGYHALWSLKTTSGSWEFGEYSNQGDGWNNVPLLSYVTDAAYNNGPNGTTYQIRFPLASGTVALTSQISDVNTAQYLRSLGNKNCQIGRTQDYGDVYSYNTRLDNTGAPTDYTSVIGFGRGTAGTVEIAGGWCNTGLYWRSLRDTTDNWYSWRTVLDDSNYTQFIDNYYWANVKISTTSSTETSPTVHTLTATRICAGHNPEIDNSISCSNWFRSSGNTGWYNTTYSGGWYMSDTSWIRAHNDVGIYTGGQIYSSNSIRMSDIYLQNGNEINNSNSNLYLNYRTTSSISMCNGGGAVIIGPMVDNIGNNKLYVNGSATIAGDITIIGSTTLNSTATFNGLVTNKGGILPASYNVNNNGTACYVWGDAMSSGVTAITDALDPRYVTVTYSRDNGRTWTNYVLSDKQKFSLYANNGNYFDIYSGNQQSEGDSAPVRVNQLMVTFEIPNSLYSELCWASVDIGNGATTICTVEIIAKDGTIQNVFTKSMYGWNLYNYINFYAINSSTTNIGKDTSRFVRFKFKRDATDISLRNTQIRKIRLFSFTKYSLDTADFRSIMGNTGHLYKYDENLNVTFPNTIKTTALEVSGNASFYDLYCKTLNHPSSTGTLVIGDKTQEVGIRSSSDSTTNALYLRNRLSSNVIFNANQGFGITPYYLSDNPYTDNTIIISGDKYKATTIGNGTRTISCVIASKCFIPPSFGTIKGYLIRFLPGNDGQIVILKNLYTKGNGNGLPLYVRPEGCDIIAGDRSSIYIKNGTLSTSFNDDDSRIFIYVAKYFVWVEFYCG